MPRFLVGITHRVYRHRVFAIAGAIAALFLILLATLPALFASDPKLSNTAPVYSEVSKEVVDGLVHSSVSYREGTGIPGMRHVAQDLGGSLEVHAAPPFTLAVSIPLSPDATVQRRSS